jgi:hypothetical protein
MPSSHLHKRGSAILAAMCTGVIIGSSLLATQAASAQATAARPDCPAREAFVPGEDNYIVGNPDDIQVSGGVASWSEYRNVNGAPAPPGFILALQTNSFCRYNYEIWGNSSLGSPYYQRSDFFRTGRPFG